MYELLVALVENHSDGPVTRNIYKLPDNSYFQMFKKRRVATYECYELC